jgi:hypothetical protein
MPGAPQSSQTSRLWPRPGRCGSSPRSSRRGAPSRRRRARRSAQHPSTVWLSGPWKGPKRSTAPVPPAALNRCAAASASRVLAASPGRPSAVSSSIQRSPRTRWKKATDSCRRRLAPAAFCGLRVPGHRGPAMPLIRSGRPVGEGQRGRIGGVRSTRAVLNAQSASRRFSARCPYSGSPVARDTGNSASAAMGWRRVCSRRRPEGARAIPRHPAALQDHGNARAATRGRRVPPLRRGP